ncbi:hypothetical protein LXL04_023450 [Taraxacum kok-saghyz]
MFTVYGAVTYYGRIKEKWDLDYHMFTVPVFMCEWVDNRAVTRDALGFTVVNFERLGSQTEPFILATQAKQVFYVQDQENENLSVVGVTPHKMYKYELNDEAGDMLEFDPTVAQDLAVLDLDDDFLCSRPDGEGILVVFCVMASDSSTSDQDEASKPRGPTITSKSKKMYFLLDPKSRKHVLRSVGTKWWNFKHYLFKKFIEPFTEDPEANILNRPEMYPYLKKDDWRLFVAQRLSKPWLEKSAYGKAVRAQHRYNHRMSRKGYSRLLDELVYIRLINVIV